MVVKKKPLYAYIKYDVKIKLFNLDLYLQKSKELNIGISESVIQMRKLLLFNTNIRYSTIFLLPKPLMFGVLIDTLDT